MNENRISIARTIDLSRTEKQAVSKQDHQWKPEPCLLSKVEIRKLIVEQLG